MIGQSTECISPTQHEMPDGMVMLNSAMTPEPCVGINCNPYPCSGETKCINATHHRMPLGMVMMNSAMATDPCAAPVTSFAQPKNAAPWLSLAMLVAAWFY